MKKSKGFTLIEMLVAIGIIAILMGILLPVILKARENGNQLVCLSNERQILNAIVMYANANHGYLPGNAAPCVNDPRLVNAQPGEVIDPLHPDWSQMDVWNDAVQISRCELSNMSMLQGYLGGISNWKIWQCPSSQDMWREASPVTPNDPDILCFFYRRRLGYGYMVNNVPYWSATYPKLIFGGWPTGSGPQRLTSIKATVSVDPTADYTLDDPKASTFSSDTTKIWLVSDMDGRDGSGMELGLTFGTNGGLVIPFTVEQRNAFNWQPVHRENSTMPTSANLHSGLGRNYGFLDGHAEYLGYGDWPHGENGIPY